MRLKTAHNRNTHGFTLLELMVAVAVMAILALLAVPSFNSFIANQRVKTASQNLFTSLSYARGEAIRRNDDVHVRIDTNANGPIWIVTPSAAQTPDDCLGNTATPDNCLRVYQATTAVTLDAGQVTFRRNGRASFGATFTLCDAEQRDSVAKRVIRVDLTGRPNIALEGGCAP